MWFEAGDYAYPSDLAGLVLTRWHEAIATGQIALPALDISTLARRPLDLLPGNAPPRGGASRDVPTRDQRA
jgi:hypothetical protein